MLILLLLLFAPFVLGWHLLAGVTWEWAAFLGLLSPLGLLLVLWLIGVALALNDRRQRHKRRKRAENELARRRAERNRT